MLRVCFSPLFFQFPLPFPCLYPSLTFHPSSPCFCACKVSPCLSQVRETSQAREVFQGAGSVSSTPYLPIDAALRFLSHRGNYIFAQKNFLGKMVVAFKSSFSFPPIFFLLHLCVGSSNAPIVHRQQTRVGLHFEALVVR